MLPHPTLKELFNGHAVALHDPELDVFIAKGHHTPDQLTSLLNAGQGVPEGFRSIQVIPATVTTTWAQFAWHRPHCDAVGEDRPWCLCGLDEAGARVDWHPTPAGSNDAGAIPVTWFNATRTTAT